jgi:exodeoxyribonuclease V alpha subunit
MSPGLLDKPDSPDREPQQPASAAERYGQLLGERGTDPAAAWAETASENHWWQHGGCPEPGRLDVAGFARDEAGLTDRMALAVAVAAWPDTATRYTVPGGQGHAGEGEEGCLVNPWRVMPRVRRFGLKDADRCADLLGLPRACPDRHEAVAVDQIGQELGLMWNGGNTHASYRDVCGGSKYLPGIGRETGLPPAGVADLMRRMEQRGLLVTRSSMQIRVPWGFKSETRVATAGMYDREARIVRALAVPRGTRFTVPAIPGKLDEDQAAAFTSAFTAPVTLLTAPPGCGKTRVSAAILQAAGAAGIPAGAGAFMGRSAERLRQEIGKLGGADLEMKPDTLHRLFRIDGRDRAGLDQESLPPRGIFIIDEASMLSAGLLAAVLEALPGGWNLVLAGDVDQLPPVEPGGPFADLLASGLFPVRELAECYRSESKGILAAAQAMRDGEVPVPGRGLEVISVGQADAVQAVVDAVRRAAFIAGCDPLDVMVICAQNKSAKGAVTTGDLNRVLAAALNPGRRDSRQWWEPRPGDKVAACGTGGLSANRAHAGRAYNGEMGVLERVAPDGIGWVRWEGRAGLAEYGEFEVNGPGRLLELSFAVTAHKSQGGEWPAVVVVADPAAYLNNRTVAYTSISRAKLLTVVVDVAAGGKTGLAAAVAKRLPRRETWLPVLLDDLLERAAVA